MKILPPEKRRSISSRLEDILADPKAAACKKSCRICKKIPPKTRQSALAVWDHYAKSGEWPRYTIILQFLRANELPCSREYLKLLLAHRRYRILDRLVKQDIKICGVEKHSLA